MGAAHPDSGNVQPPHRAHMAFRDAPARSAVCDAQHIARPRSQRPRGLDRTDQDVGKPLVPHAAAPRGTYSRGMSRRKRTPAEKKALARARDRLDAFDENQKSSRKNIPLHRARLQRAHRRAVAQRLLTGDELGAADLRRKRWSTWPGPTLGDGVDGALQRRAKLQETPRRSAEVRARRSTRRSGTRR
jgi:hypothetical protein